MLVYFYTPTVYPWNYGVEKRNQILRIEMLGTVFFILGRDGNPHTTLCELPHKMNKSQAHAYIIETIYKI
jgi:peptidoglycan/xylan/chitin deacetylase (PgdA/CDA1 family)